MVVKKGILIFGTYAFILFFTACSPNQGNLEKNLQLHIDNMRSQSYDFKGQLHMQVGEETMEELLVLDGSYVANEGYVLHADVNLPGFETESNILSTDGHLFYKLPQSSVWKPTTDQDLRMLGITYIDSPVDLFYGMKEIVLTVERTERNDMFQITLDRSEYEKMADRDGTVHLPQVDIQSDDLQLNLAQNPVVNVEVDLDRKLIRSLTLNYVVEPPLDGPFEQPLHVTYEMQMEQFNEEQTLPEL